MRKELIIFSVFLSLFLGCTQPQNNQLNLTNQTTVQGINYTNALLEGCVRQNGQLNCSKLGLEEMFSCSSVHEVNFNSSALNPNIQIVECNFWKDEVSISEDVGIVRNGCMAPIYTKFIVGQTDDLKEINTSAQFVKYFAPVESKEEALAFAIALTGSYPIYDKNIPTGNVLEPGAELKITEVNEINGSYNVRLFDYTICGCGPHYHYEVDYLVTKNGKIEEKTRTQIYRNPEMDFLCVD